MTSTEETSSVRDRNRGDVVGLNSDSVAELTYRYLQQFPCIESEISVNDWDSIFDGEGAGDTAPILDRLFGTEGYSGEAFDATVEPDPRRLVSPFAADVGIDAADIVGISAPSSQLFDSLFYSLLGAVTQSSAVLTTKYPTCDVRRQVPDLDPVVLDCTPGAETDSGVDRVTGQVEPLRCGDLVSIGVAAQRATDQVAVTNGQSTFAISTLTQLRSHHDKMSFDRFLHELIGQWRNRGVGGLVHVPPVSSNDEDRCLASAHFDYVVEFATKHQTVVARILGKCDVKPTWRPLGASAVVGETGV